MYLKNEQYQKLLTESPYNIKYRGMYSLIEIENVFKEVINSCVADIVSTVLHQQKIDPELDLLSRNEVCEILKVTKATLHNYKHSGKLIPFKKNGRVYYRKLDIKNYLNGKGAQNDR